MSGAVKAAEKRGARTIVRLAISVSLFGATVAFLVTASGCLGPQSLELTRLRYDQAVHDTTEQQWLRNIVRMRYGDLPSFLDVSAITSQFELSGRGNLLGGQERDSINRTLVGDLSLQFRDAPTLSYTPRDPTELTRAMIAPVGITALGLLANNGWRLEDVLRVMVGEVNGIQNTPGAEALVPVSIPTPSRFPEVVQLMGSLRSDRLLTLASIEEARAVSPAIPADRINGSDLVQAASHSLEYRTADDPDSMLLTRTEPHYKFTFAPSSIDRPEVDALRELLHLTPGRLEYNVHRVYAPGGLDLLPLPEMLDAVDVRPRTLLEMLTVLSKGVEIPEDHAKRGLAAQTIAPNGEWFDWTCTTQGLFLVRSQKKRPRDAGVAIQHHGWWFYIPAADKRSKSTLAMIQALFNLQLSEPKKAGPLLTLPVGF